MIRAWKECGANPASQHSPGRNARRGSEDAREGIAKLLGAKTGGMDADQLIFTSGGTEANNLALLGLITPPPAKEDQTGRKYLFGAELVVSAAEHPSVFAAAHELVRRGMR